jgi:hypothetical protein
MSEQVPPSEFQKWVHEINRQDAQRAHDKLDAFHEYVNQATIKSAELALRMSILINGGAAVALLTFIGPLPKQQKADIANTLVWFASGVALGVAALAASYFTNYLTAGIASSKLRLLDHPYIKPGPTTARHMTLKIIFHVIAVILGLASLGAFVCGMLEVRNALTRLA